MNLENKEHSETFLKFYNWLTDDQDSSAQNASTYLKILRLFSIDVGCKKLGKITKEDVIAFLDKRKKSVEVDPEKKWQRTWNDYLARLTGFYKWFSNQDSETSRDEWETPEPIKSIKKKKNRRYSSYSPNDVWTQDELLLAVKYCDNIRDKVIFTLCWDIASRNQEIVKMRIRDIVIKEKYAEVSTAWDTKTGTRTNPIILGFPYLKQLLNEHPFALDPNAYLFLSKTTMKPLTSGRIWSLADILKKRITKMIKENKIRGEDRERLIKLLQKPWNPYLLGRHSSITEKTDILNDFQLKQYAGWSISSIRPRTYIHRKGKQVINPLLQEHGIIEKQERKPVRKECPKCSFINTTEATICSNCSFVLNARGWKHTRLEEEQKEKELRLQLNLLDKKMTERDIKIKEQEIRIKNLERMWLENHARPMPQT